MADNKKNNGPDPRLEELKKNFKLTQEAWEAVRKASVADLKFLSGEQADPTWETAAKAKGRGNLITCNRLWPYVTQIENLIRDSNPTISVHPTDEVASEETARVQQGMIRRIERVSNASTAYMSAAGVRGALGPGFGFIKIETGYVNNKSFNQDIFIREVKDPFKVLPDFDAKSSDFSDANYWFEFDDISKSEFKKKYPKSKLATSRDWSLVGEATGELWVRENQVRIARYWYKESTTRTLVQFEDGTVGYLDEFGIDEDGNEAGEATKQIPQVPTTQEEQELELAQTMQVSQEEFNADTFQPTLVRNQRMINMRLVDDSKVVWCDSNGFEILETGDWHNDDFPFVAVTGTDMFVDGKRKIFGLVRFAKDSQKMFNYVASNFVRKIAATNQSPWIADVRSIPENLRSDWEKSNVDPKALLMFNGVDNLGQPIAPPTRGDAYEPAVDALLKGSVKFEEDIKASLGVYDASVGKGIGERQSGVAIETLAQRGEETNLHFSQNLVSAIRVLGQKLIRLMPLIYDTARVVQIVNPENKAELVKINQLFTDKSGKQTAHMLGEGEYAVEVDIGPNYQTRKAEQLAEMMEFVTVYPAAFPLVADLIAKNTDWAVKDELYERMYSHIAYNMPWLITPPEMEDVPPNTRQFIVTLLKKADDLGKSLAELNQEYQKQQLQIQANVVNNESKERVQQMKIIGDLQVEKIRLQSTFMQNQSRENLAQLRLAVTDIQAKQKMALERVRMIDKANKQEMEHSLALAALQREIERDDVSEPKAA